MGEYNRIQTAFATCVLFLLIGAFLMVPFASQSAAASDDRMTAPALGPSSQTIADGDYIQYVVTVGSDTGIRRFDFSNMNATRMTVDITSTISYFSSASFTANYSYQDNMVEVPGLMGELPQGSKVSEANISTPFGMKHVNVFSFMDTGPYSDVQRTFLVPVDCLVYYKYYGNDTDGNHVVITLDQTNIGWLQNVGHVTRESDFIFTVNSGEATITDYIGPGGELYIPSTLGGYPVVGIGFEAFANSASITSVAIPNSVTSMEGGHAFINCTALTSVTLGNGILGPGMWAFAYCTALISVTIPFGINHIDYAAFYGCTALTTVTLPGSINFMPELGFAHCIALTSITFKGLVAPTNFYSSWIEGDSSALRGHASARSNFPLPGEMWNGLTMGSFVPEGYVDAPPGFTWHESSKGYSILIPNGWTVLDDGTVGGSQADTIIWGPIAEGVHTNVIVLTGTDTSLIDSQTYLSQKVQDAVSSLSDEGMTPVISGSPEYIKISNRSAVLFGIDATYSGVAMHQIAAIIIDAEHSRYWIITCTESANARAQFDTVFDTIINDFTITSIPSLTGLDMFVIVAIAIVVGTVLLIIVFSVVKRSNRTKVTPPYLLPQGNAYGPSGGFSSQPVPPQNQSNQPQSWGIQQLSGSPSSASSHQSLNYCPWCGAQTIGSQFCGNCGRELRGTPPSP